MVHDGLGGTDTTVYHYDSSGNLMTETDELGNLTRDYLWQEDLMPAAQIDNNGTEAITYLHTDHLMTARLATDNAQQVTWRWEGEAFGATPATELDGTAINLRFPGQYFDEETNLHYNHFRYYDPEIGRYITSDPIGLDGGNNTVSYAVQNPITVKDTYGLAPEDCVGLRGDAFIECLFRDELGNPEDWLPCIVCDKAEAERCIALIMPSLSSSCAICAVSRGSKVTSCLSCAADNIQVAVCTAKNCTVQTGCGCRRED